MAPLDLPGSLSVEPHQQKAEKQAAQDTLVNITLKLAVEAMYARAAQSRWEIKTTVHKPISLGETIGVTTLEAVAELFTLLSQKKPELTLERVLTALGQEKARVDVHLGTSQQEVIDALQAIPNEFDRVRTFNLLAKENAFNLSIKTAGPKSPESAARKAGMPSNKDKPLSDAVRVSVVSGYPHRLDWMAEQLHAILSERTHPVEGLNQNIEDWEMTGNALLRKVLKNNVDGFGAEIQFLPREQSRMAARITHHFFKVTRLYDDVSTTLKAASEETKLIIKDESGKVRPLRNTEAYAIGKKLEMRSSEMFEAYTKVATFMNRLCSDEIMRDTDREEFNALLRNMDASPQTYDDISEGEPQLDPSYSPIFKTMRDIKTYRAYMREKGAIIGLFPLPEINQNSSPKEVEAAMLALRKCSQLTHACYMNDAKEPMRNLWVAKAREANEAQNNPAERIPECAIDCVSHSLDKNPPAPARGASYAR